VSWTPESTIAALENTWGQYKPGMKAVVKSYLNGSSSTWLESVFEVMTETHAGGWPPSKADIMAQHDEIKSRSMGKAVRNPVNMRLTESTEDYVDPETGLKMIQEIIAKIGSKKI
jgi:hypothetical protein